MHNKKISFFAILFTAATGTIATPSTAQPVTGNSGSLTVNLVNRSGKTGTVFVAACTEETFLTRHCTLRNKVAITAADASTASTTFTGLPAGRYAVQAFIDVDGNGDINRNLLGLPQEPLAFSNNVSLRSGKPRFEKSAVTVGAGATATTSATLENLF